MELIDKTLPYYLKKVGFANVSVNRTQECENDDDLYPHPQLWWKSYPHYPRLKIIFQSRNSLSAMTQAIPKPVTFEEFVDRLPENTGVRYELHNGSIVEMAQPVGDYEEVKGFIAKKVTVEFARLDFPFIIPNQVIVRPLEKDSGYFPDVLVLNQTNLINEPLWKKPCGETKWSRMLILHRV